jgi:hypothetical protein
VSGIPEQYNPPKTDEKEEGPSISGGNPLVFYLNFFSKYAFFLLRLSFLTN